MYSNELMNLIFRQMSCHMVTDLLRLARQLEQELPGVNKIMAYLKPKFTLVGSAAEGTRIGLGSEIDLTMRFEGWMHEGEAPFKLNLGSDHSDHLQLHKGLQTPEWAEWYFGGTVELFHLDKFKYDLLSAFDSALCKIFREGKNPARLEIQPNVHKLNSPSRGCQKCDDRMNKMFDDYGGQWERTNIQCKNCMFATSQTKLGICLQFMWVSETGMKAYCSMDVIPAYKLVTFFCNISRFILQSTMKLQDDRMLHRKWRN